jgi:hypothetical protein
MRLALALAVITVLAAMPVRPEPAIRYFKSVRDVRVSDSSRQNYFVVDQEIWTHSRQDLGDLRLYAGDSPVQYAVSEQREGFASDEVEVKILNLGVVSGHTEFDLDMQGLSEYNRIRLRLDAHDFVATAFVSGGDAPGKAAKVELNPSTLYDFTKEQLGSNSLVKIQSSSFRFLHIKLSDGIRPQDVKSASVFQQHEQQASWTEIGSCTSPEQKQRSTVVTCNVPDHVPVTRIAFEIPSSIVNFRRGVTIEDSKGAQIASGEISRVRMNRAGTLITNEQLALSMGGSTGKLTVVIDNGDNPALDPQSVQTLVIEHRIYFDPEGKTGLKLYYGDQKLSAPVYDYARFFHLEGSPAQADLGSVLQNPVYSGRPDERPWSERHTAILWTAMLITVVALVLLALRGMRAPSGKQPRHLG